LYRLYVTCQLRLSCKQPSPHVTGKTLQPTDRVGSQLTSLATL
jgi:hypothetical protein